MVDKTDDTPADSANVLVVDDDPSVRQLLLTMLTREGAYRLFESPSGAEAQSLLTGEEIDVVITDLRMPGMDGIALMKWARERCPGPTWIILTGHGSLDDAVQAIRLGAYDFVSKPLPAPESLLVTVRNAVHERQLRSLSRHLQQEVRRQNDRLREQVSQLEQACRLLHAQTRAVQEDFRRAAQIQQALLPRSAETLEGLAVDAMYRPCRSVAGDLYDTIPIDERRLAFYVADAVGHGVAAAMLAVLLKTQLRPTRPGQDDPIDPGEVLADVNEYLAGKCHGEGMFVTAAYGVLDTAAGIVTIASAGHPPVLLRRADGRVESVGPTGPALGLKPRAVYVQQEMTLQPGDRMLLYTDGLYATGASTDNSDHLLRALGESELGGQALLKSLLGPTPEDGSGQAYDDDVTLLLISVTEAASAVDNAGPAELAPRSVPAPGFDMKIGASGQATVVSLVGRADWTYCAPFHQACVEAMGDHGALLLDLTECTHLDSTFLGTIHELTERGDREQSTVRIQGVDPELLDHFEELGMTDALEHIVADSVPLPDDMIPLTDGSKAEEDLARVLQAHEALAGLNDRNREQFANLIEYLGKEIREHRCV